MIGSLKMKTVILSLILILLITFIVISFLPTNKEPNNTPSNVKTHSEYIIKLHENSIGLFENGKLVKYYDVNPSILPGEDLTLLSEGISVSSVAQADKIAEDFDG